MIQCYSLAFAATELASQGSVWGGSVTAGATVILLILTHNTIHKTREAYKNSFRSSSRFSGNLQSIFSFAVPDNLVVAACAVLPLSCDMVGVVIVLYQ